MPLSMVKDDMYCYCRYFIIMIEEWESLPSNKEDSRDEVIYRTMPEQPLTAKQLPGVRHLPCQG